VRALAKLGISEVLVKLDGQMIVGVVVGTEVQMWSRKGLTAVGVTAFRVASSGECGDCIGLVRDVVAMGCTPSFELVGAQSKVRAEEGMEPRLVLIAVREHQSGAYWGHGQLVELGGQYGVEVVRRLNRLEGLDVNGIADCVAGWVGKEGVVVRFSDGTAVKVKSRWWFRSGFGPQEREQDRRWRHREAERQQRQQELLQTREQRLVVVGFQGMVQAGDVFRVMTGAAKAEFVTDKKTGKLRVVTVSFMDCESCKVGEQAARRAGWKTRRAYSRRTRGSAKQRVVVFKSHEVGANLHIM